jgi:sialic acid synthase SpsE
MAPAAIRIGDRLVGEGAPPYVIAEIGSNHNQDLARALDMIGLAAEAGADAVKFQSLRLDEQYQRSAITDELRALFRQIQLDEAWYAALAARARECQVDFLSSPTYLRAVDLLRDAGVPAYKIASPQAYGFLEVIRQAAATGLPLIISTGYCGYAEIDRAVRTAREGGATALALLHCTSSYPVDPADANLRSIRTLRTMFGVPVGFSDHTTGAHVAVAAVAMDAAILEKHVTCDRSLPGPDHHFALDFGGFRDYVAQIREAAAALGDGNRSSVREEEMCLRDVLVMRLAAARPLRAGERLSADMIRFGRGSSGIEENAVRTVLGAVLLENVEEGQPITAAALQLRAGSTAAL